MTSEVWIKTFASRNVHFFLVLVPGQCGYSPVSRVIAGVDAKAGAWPWQVNILFL